MILAFVAKSGFWTVYLVVFMDMLGVGILIPVIRDLTIALVQNSHLLWPGPEIYMGILMASYSGAQMVSAPILGRLSDRYGRKPVFLLSTIGNAVSYVIWILANNYWFFLAGRILSGATGGNLAIAQSILADNTTPKERPRAMGLLGACIGMGFVMGPFIGGVMIKINHNFMIGFNPFGVIGILPLGLSLLAVFLIFFNQFGRIDAHQPRGGALAGFLAVFQPPQRSTYATQLLSQLSFVSFEVLFAWILQRQYGFNLEETYHFFGLQGLLLALVQGGLYRRLENHKQPQDWVKLGLLGAASGMLLLPWVGMIEGQLWGIALRTWALAVLMAFMAVAWGFGNPSLTAFASLTAPKNEQGQTMGNMQGLAALSRFIAPLLATSLYAVWLPLPFLVGALFCSVGYVVFSQGLVRK